MFPIKTQERILLVLFCLFCLTSILSVTLLKFPLMGHDYSYLVPNSIDFHKAWNDFGVLNPIYTPIKCLGVPLWANPVSFNLSFFHFFSLFLNPIMSIIAYISLYTILFYFGTFLFMSFFTDDILIKIAFSIGWTLQANIIANAIVGHFSYIINGIFPLLFFLILKPKSSFKVEFISLLFLTLLFSQFIFAGAHATPFLWTSSFFISILLLKWHKFNFSKICGKKVFILRTVSLITFLLAITLPRVLDIFRFTSNYPREVKFIDVGILKVIEYSFNTLLISTPFDAKNSVGWGYGNWESNQGIMPFFVIFIFIFFYLKKKESLLDFGLSIFFLLCTSILICSGIYADIFSKLPLLKSLHVNPRWNTLVILPLFVVFSCTLKQEVEKISKKIWIFFCIIFLFFPFLFLQPEHSGLGYFYKSGYSSTINRLNYCYEPVFGYGLESLPIEIKKLNLFGPDLADPRCYLKGASCTPGTLLNVSDKNLLNQYRLK